MPQQPEEHVKHDHGPRVAQMRAVIDRGTADIHPHILRINRREILFLPGGGVVQLDRQVTGHGQASLRGCDAGLA